MKIISKLVGGLLLGAASFSSHAGLNVSLFFDDSYVDTGREALYMEDDLAYLGHTVSQFSGIADAGWSAAMSGADALVIPELERNPLIGDLSSTTQGNIFSYVQSGGTLVVAGDSSGHGIDLVNTIFGSSVSSLPGSETGALDTVAVAGTAYAGGPSLLPDSNATYGYDRTSAPTGALIPYVASGSDFVPVMQFAAGLGSVTLLGFDWYAGDLAVNGNAAGFAAREEWRSVLNSGLGIAPASTPTPLLLMLAGAGLLFYSRQKRSA